MQPGHARCCDLSACRYPVKLGKESASAMIGDLERGYIVPPINDVIRNRMEKKASLLGVKITA